MLMLNNVKVPTTKNFKFRLVEEIDAKFILQLRLNESLNAHLSNVQNDVALQQAWINQYKERENNSSEFYFIIETLEGEPVGTVRLYDFQNDSFCWGSWILLPGVKPTAAIETALLVYFIAYEALGFTKTHFDVRKSNEKVISFHKKLGAEKISEDEENYYFINTAENYKKAKMKYQRFFLSSQL